MNKPRTLLHCLAVLAVLISPASLQAESEYRKALKAYWKGQFKEDGFTPLYYASTAYAPKSVWIEIAGTREFFAAGIDLLPESRVKVLTSEISLPSDEGERNRKVSAALQFSGVKDIADADLKVRVESSLEWDTKVESAELQFFGKRDARRCLGTATAAVLVEYFKDVKDKEKLWIVEEAVFVKGATVTVKASGALEATIGANLEGALTSLGFSIAGDKKSATSQNVSQKYFAVGLRALTTDGLKSALPMNDQPVPVDLPDVVVPK